MTRKVHIRARAIWCALAAVVVWSLPVGSLFGAENWSWELPVERYQRLTMFQRAQYDKAAELFRQHAYKAAEAEFEKYKIEFPDSPALSYILFMRGYSLQMAYERNAAIQMYNEVLDYFGDRVEDAAPALYYLGLAHLQNGDTREGMEVMKEMVEDEDYQKHPLAAGALRRLADNHWKNEEPEEAIRYWKQVVRDFGRTNEEEAEVAREKVLSYYIKNQNYAAIEEWLIGPDGDNSHHRRRVADIVFKVAYNGFAGEWGKYTNFNRKERAEDVSAFWDYFKKQKQAYLDSGAAWDFHRNALQFLAHRYGNKEELDAVFNEMIAFVDKLESPGDRNNRYSWIIDQLYSRSYTEWARRCIAKITDPGLAAYKEYLVLGNGEGRWGDAANKLLEIINMGESSWQRKAEDELAYLYKNRTRQYQEAIKIYRQINRPPETLWGIQECYYRMGDLGQAMQTLNEIESMFPDDASRAAWQKASYQKEAGNREQAIGLARRILEVYPKSPQASDAHQMLEGFGVKTGGGVLNEE